MLSPETQPLPESAQRMKKSTAAGIAMQLRDWKLGIIAQARLQAGDRDRVILPTMAALVKQTRDGWMVVVVNRGPTDPAMSGAAHALLRNVEDQPATFVQNQSSPDARVCHLCGRRRRMASAQLSSTR
jgi:hypothetical protein